MTRIRLESPPEDGGNYFASEKTNLQFISSGCTLLNSVLGGGWVLGRIANIVGDKSTGKTLLAIEACANFINRYPLGKIYYREAESAFDQEYARALGMPIESINFGSKKKEFTTVEDFYFDLLNVIEKLPKGTPALYILDSLDALSDEAEMKREFTDNTYGQNKAKKMSELFRRLVQKIETADICVIIISQVRSKIGVTFGRDVSRTGGRALDFYCSQVIYLQHIAQLHRTRNKIKRPIGVKIRAKCDKNKVGLPFRECEFPILFGFGVDELTANVEWLDGIKRLDVLEEYGTEDVKIIKFIDRLEEDEYRAAVRKINGRVKRIWREIEQGFLPTRKKY